MIQKIGDRNPLLMPPLDDADAAIQAIIIIEQILVELKSIPCMSEHCGGIENGESATKHHPTPTRCHRCAAIRLAKQGVNG